MLDITLNTEGLEDIRKQLVNQKNKLSNSEGFNKILSKLISDDVIDRFNKSPKTQKGGLVPGGEIWKPLSNSYLDSRPDRRNKQILVDTGRLKNSFRLDNPENKVSNSFQSWSYATLVPYAAKQNKFRKFLFWHSDLLEKVKIAYQSYIFSPDNIL